MADSSSPSFIPKRNPVKQVRRVASRQIYVFTIIAYALIFAALLASGGVFFYDKIVERQRDSEINRLAAAVASFRDADMQRVVEIDGRLKAAASRVNNSVSMRSLFDLLERSTINTAQLSELTITREGDDQIVMEAKIETDSFDSVLFQRGAYEENLVVDSLVFEEVLLQNSTLEEDGASAIGAPRTVVAVSASFSVLPSAIPYVPQIAPASLPTSDQNQPGTATETSGEEIN